MLQPTEQWQWQLNPAQNQLFLDIDASMAFTTAYRQKHLTADVLSENAFNLEDATYYQQTVAILNEMHSWSVPEVVQLSLNATAARRFYKPTMPKSWFFKTNRLATLSAAIVDNHAICLLYTDYGFARFLVVEQGPRASVCMLLDPELPLDENRSMTSFDIIKVMNDRQFSHNELRQQMLQTRSA